MNINKEVADREIAFANNPAGLKKRQSVIGPDLLSTLAEQEVVRKRNAAAKQAEQDKLIAAMTGTQGTVKDQISNQFMNPNMSQAAKGVQIAGMMPPMRMPQGIQGARPAPRPPMGGARPPMGAPQGIMGARPAPRPPIAQSGIANAPMPQPMRMASGGIVGYAPGGEVDEDEKKITPYNRPDPLEEIIVRPGAYSQDDEYYFDPTLREEQDGEELLKKLERLAPEVVVELERSLFDAMEEGVPDEEYEGGLAERSARELAAAKEAEAAEIERKKNQPFSDDLKDLWMDTYGKLIFGALDGAENAVTSAASGVSEAASAANDYIMDIEQPRARAVWEEAKKDAAGSEGGEAAGKMFRGALGAGVGGILDALDGVPSDIGDFVSTLFTGEGLDKPLGETIDDLLLPTGGETSSEQGETKQISQEEPDTTTGPGVERDLMAPIAPEDMPEDIGGLGFETAPTKLSDSEALETAMNKKESAGATLDPKTKEKEGLGSLGQFFKDIDWDKFGDFARGAVSTSNRNLGAIMAAGSQGVKDEERYQEALQMKKDELAFEQKLAEIKVELNAGKLDQYIAKLNLESLNSLVAIEQAMEDMRPSVQDILRSDDGYMEAGASEKRLLEDQVLGASQLGRLRDVAKAQMGISEEDEDDFTMSFQG